MLILVFRVPSGTCLFFLRDAAVDSRPLHALRGDGLASSFKDTSVGQNAWSTVLHRLTTLQRTDSTRLITANSSSSLHSWRSKFDQPAQTISFQSWSQDKSMRWGFISTFNVWHPTGTYNCNCGVLWSIEVSKVSVGYCLFPSELMALRGCISIRATAPVT